MTLHITEFRNVASAQNGAGPVQAASGIVASQNIALSGANQQSSAFGANTRFIRVYAVVPAKIAIGDNPNASTGPYVYLGAGQFDYFGVLPGQKLAAKTA